MLYCLNHHGNPAKGTIKLVRSESWSMLYPKSKKKIFFLRRKRIQSREEDPSTSSVLSLTGACRTLDPCPLWLSGKEFTCQRRRYGRLKFDPRVGKIPRRRAWQPLQCSCLEHPTDRGGWRVSVHGVAQSRTQLRDWASAQTFGETPSAQTSVCLSLKLGICVHNAFSGLRI